MERYDEARALYERALALNRRYLGLSDPHTRQAMWGLARTYRKIDMSEEFGELAREFVGLLTGDPPTMKLPAGNFEVNLGKDIGRLVFSGRHSKHHENAPFQVRQSDDGIRPWTGEQIVISGRQDTLATSIKHGGIHKKIKKLQKFKANRDYKLI